jgi:HK97 family phage prohead protease
MERRLIHHGKIELRSTEGEEGPVIVHHAPPWESLSQVIWWEHRGVIKKAVREKFAKGAFGDLVKGDVRGLYNHDRDHLLARTTSGTLLLEEDDVGLRYEMTLPSTSLGRDIAISIERGDLDGSSFSFAAEDEEWEETDDELIRTVTKVAMLCDVGPVTFPAYEHEGISLREAGYCREAKQSLDRFLAETMGDPADRIAEQRRRQLLAEMM